LAFVVTLAQLRKVALELPEVTEKPCFGTPAWYVRKKIIARFREEEGGADTFVVKCEMGERDALVAAEPRKFSVTDHYRNYPMVIVHMNAVGVREARELLTDGWRLCAPKKLVAEFDAVS
jgi:hypothetical protein